MPKKGGRLHNGRPKAQFWVCAWKANWLTSVANQFIQWPDPTCLYPPWRSCRPLQRLGNFRVDENPFPRGRQPWQTVGP